MRWIILKLKNKSLSLKLIQIFIKFQKIRLNYILVDDLPLQWNSKSFLLQLPWCILLVAKIWNWDHHLPERRDSDFIPRFCKIFEISKSVSLILLSVKNEPCTPNFDTLLSKQVEIIAKKESNCKIGLFWL